MLLFKHLVLVFAFQQQIFSQCIVKEVKSGKTLPCQLRFEYEYEYEYERIAACDKFDMNPKPGDRQNPQLKKGDSLKKYQGKYWCATVKNYSPSGDDALQWGICDPKVLPKDCFFEKPNNPTRSSTSPTRLPTPLSPTRRGTKTINPTLQPTVSPTPSLPTTSPTILPTPAPSKSPTKKNNRKRKGKRKRKSNRETGQ